MTTHATRSPSRAHRFMRCAGSINEEAKYPERPSGPAAIDGTHTHTLLEMCVNAKFDRHEVEFQEGNSFNDHEGHFIADKDRIARVQVALDYIVARSLNYTFPVASEERVSPAHYLGRDDMDGTIDVQIQRPDELEIIDYKDGMEPVEVRGNEQLEIYALAALSKLKLPINGPYPFKHVTMTVIQPKLALKGLPPIVSHTMTVQEVIDLIPKYVAGAAATDRPDAPLTPGKKQCRYCRASGCAARVNEALSAAGVQFAPVEVKKENPVTTEVVDTAAQQLATQDPTALSDERLAEILEAAPLMRQTIEQAEAEALRRLETGVYKGDRLKLVYGRGSQVWNLPEEQIAEKLKGMGVPKDAVFKTSVVSPAQAKKLSWENRKGEKKGLSERQLKTLETEYISKLAGKLTVAPASDPRPAVVRDAAPLFGAVQPQIAPPVDVPVPAWMTMPTWMQPQ